MTEEPTLENLVEQAKTGNQAALETLIRRIQHQVYNLARRMLWHPADAEDATQEILIKIMTHLSQYRQESAFTTWVYRVATNYLLTTRKRRAEQRQATFEEFGQQLESRMDVEVNLPPDGLDQRLLLKEVELSCTMGMLLCLDREHRLAYILGELFGVTSEEGAYILEISSLAYRKRLSRARTRMRGFMNNTCGLVNPANNCHCERQLGHKVKYEKLGPARLMFAGASTAAPTIASDFPPGLVEQSIAELEKLDRTVAIFRHHPAYAAPDNFMKAIKQLLESDNFEILK